MDRLVVLWRVLNVDAGFVWLTEPLECTSSSLEGLLFCSFDWIEAGCCDVHVVIVVGVIDRWGSRVVGARSSILFEGGYCDL